MRNFSGANKGYEKMVLRGAKISMENLRGAKISVENLKGYEKCSPVSENISGYPDIKSDNR